MKQIHLNDLREKCSKLSPKRCDSFAEAGAVAFENQAHRPGVELLVDAEPSQKFQLTWDKPDARNDWQEPTEVANLGAVAVGLSMAFELTEFEVVRQAKIGATFDYHLGYNKGDPRYDPDNFLAARLEISGINKGTTSQLSQRVREKMRQMDPSDGSGLPAFVAVTEFGKPITVFKKK